MIPIEVHRIKSTYHETACQRYDRERDALPKVERGILHSGNRNEYSCCCRRNAERYPAKSILPLLCFIKLGVFAGWLLFG